MSSLLCKFNNLNMEREREKKEREATLRLQDTSKTTTISMACMGVLMKLNDYLSLWWSNSETAEHSAMCQKEKSLHNLISSVYALFKREMFSNWQGLNILSYGNWIVSPLMEKCQTCSYTQQPPDSEWRSVRARGVKHAEEKRKEICCLLGYWRDDDAMMRKRARVVFLCCHKAVWNDFIPFVQYLSANIITAGSRAAQVLLILAPCFLAPPPESWSWTMKRFLLKYFVYFFKWKSYLLIQIKCFYIRGEKNILSNEFSNIIFLFLNSNVQKYWNKITFVHTFTKKTQLL